MRLRVRFVRHRITLAGTLLFLGELVETPIFSGMCPDALGLGGRPVRRRCSDARVLYPDTAIVALCEPKDYQQLSRQWHDQDTARNLDEALHQIELERAAQPPVIEVTVTAPPGGIPRTELGRLVRDQVAELTGSQQEVSRRPVRKVLMATRRARDYIRGDLPAPSPADIPAVPPVQQLWVSEDDTPTGPIPVIREVS